MKRIGFILGILSMATTISAQEVPLFSQTITNSFMYNPALAGYDRGTLTLSSRQSFGQKLKGLPNTNYLSGQSPFSLGKLGFGGNVLYEQLGVFNQLQTNVAGAYHIRWNDEMSWSMGLGAEYYAATLDEERLDILDYDDPVINAFAQRELDFSTGFYFRYKFLGAGVAVNRLKSWILTDNYLHKYTNVFVKGMFDLGASTSLQPIVIYRRERNFQHQVDMGAYLFFKNQFLTGANFRSNGQLGFSVGTKIITHTWVAYTFEALTKYGISNHELSLRFDFNKDDYPNTNSNYKKIQGKEKYKQWKNRLKKKGLKNKGDANMH